MIRLLAATLVVGTLFVLSPERTQHPAPTLPAEGALAALAAEAARTAGMGEAAGGVAGEIVRREWLRQFGDAARPASPPPRR